jgi:hypothetical protein
MVAQIFAQISQIHITVAQAQSVMPIIAIIMFGWAARQVWNIIEGK